MLCTVCARGGSKGVPNKNSRLINHRPLLSYTLTQAKASNLFSHIVLSTDSPELQSIGREYGADSFFLRPAELSSDSAPKIPVIQHALLQSESYYNQTFDIIIDLDATSPLRDVEDIIMAYNLFLKNNNDNLITAAPARRSPYFNLIEVNADGGVSLSKPLNTNIARRQDAPKCYDMNASIYIWKRETLLNESRLFLQNTGLYIMPEERSLDIDSELDFKLVELLLKEKP